jgi:hypothetical protein
MRGRRASERRRQSDHRMKFGNSCDRPQSNTRTRTNECGNIRIWTTRRLSFAARSQRRGPRCGNGAQSSAVGNAGIHNSRDGHRYFQMHLRPIPKALSVTAQHSRCKDIASANERSPFNAVLVAVFSDWLLRVAAVRFRLTCARRALRSWRRK